VSAHEKDKSSEENDVSDDELVDEVEGDTNQESGFDEDLYAEDFDEEYIDGDEEEVDIDEDDEDEEDVEILKPRIRSREVTPADRKLSPEEMEKETKTVLEDFIETEDKDEAYFYISQLGDPSFYPTVVDMAINHALEKSEKGISITKLFLHLFEKQLFLSDHFISGFANALEIMPDLVLDIPLAGNYFGILLGHGVAHGYLPVQSIAKPELFSSMVTTGLAEKILTNIFRTIVKEKDPNTAHNIYNQSTLDMTHLIKLNGKVTDKDIANKNFAQFLESNVDLAPAFSPK